MKKRLLVLGASIVQKTLIEYAKSIGIYVIAFDMDSQAVCKNIVDEFYQISTTDYKKALAKAKELNIDGVTTYASDPSAPCVAYIGNHLSLPSNPFTSVVTMCNKGKFRSFLKMNGFNFPKYKLAKSFEEFQEYTNLFKTPFIVKPVDSSGSRGVTKVESSKVNLLKIYNEALKFSKSKEVVIEEFISRKLFQVAGDGFLYNGKLIFRSFANEHFNEDLNGLVPIGESFPSIHSKENLQKAHNVIQDIMTKLDMKIGALNFDFIIDKEDNVYVIEIGPRNGGNLIPEVISLKDSFDMVKYTVDIALNQASLPMEVQSNDNSFYSSYMINSTQNMLFNRIDIDKSLNSKIIQINLNVQKGDKVEKFTGANKAIGSMILRFKSSKEMLTIMQNIKQYVKIF